MTTPFIATFSVENAHESDVYALATCPLFTVAGSGDGNISMWDNRKPSESPALLTAQPVRAGIHHLSVDKGGNYAVAVAFDGSVLAFDLKEHKQLDIVKSTAEIKGAWGCAVSGNLAAICALQGDITVINLESDEIVAVLGEPMSSIDVKRQPCLCVDISQDGKYVVGGYDTGKARVFSVETGRISYSLPSHITRPRCIKFNQQVTMVAVTGDASIALFTLSGGSYVGSILGHDSFIYDIDFEEDGQRLLSVAGDGKAKIWALDTREAKFTTGDSNAPLFACAWVPERTTIIGGAPAGVVTAGVDRCLRWYREASGSDL